MGEAIFRRDGDSYLPTELARGPWSPEAQHGGPPAALLARAIEGFEPGEPALVARLTVELLRPVPIAPLRVQTRFERPGRKVQLVRASLLSDTVEVARATGLRIRRVAVPLPPDFEQLAPPAPPEQGIEGTPPWAAQAGYRAFHNAGVEHRFVAGSFAEPGPATDWIRLRAPLVEGEATSGLARVAAAADFGNGVSWVLHRHQGYSFINPDLSIYLFREPVGEWICIAARTHVGPEGIGLAESQIYDSRGRLGRSLQSLLIDQAAD